MTDSDSSEDEFVNSNASGESASGAPVRAPSSADDRARVILAAHQERQVADGKKRVRTQTSVWKTCAARVFTDGLKTRGRCFVCEKEIGLNKQSSASNIRSHYHNNHDTFFKALNEAIERRAGASELTAMFQAEKEAFRRPLGGPIESFFKQSSFYTAKNGRSGANTLDVHRVAHVLYSAATGTPLEQIGSPLHAGYIAALGGPLINVSKTPLNSMLPRVHKAVNGLICSSSSRAQVGCLTVDGWTRSTRGSVFGIALTFVDARWEMQTVPLGLIAIDSLGKSAENQAALLRNVIEKSERVGENFLMHTIVSDNEASIVSAVGQVTSADGALRCIAHTLSLALKQDVPKSTAGPDGGEGTLTRLMSKIHDVSIFVRDHGKVESLLNSDQEGHGARSDRIRSLKLECCTRWHSSLAVLEAYLALSENLARVFDDPDVQGLRRRGHLELPTLLDESEIAFANDVVTILNEVRRVGRALEAEKAVTASRAPRLLWELVETLQLWARTKDLSSSRKSSAGDDMCRIAARAKVLLRRDSRDLAGAVAKAIEGRLGYLWRIPRTDDDESVSRRARLFHMAAMFDVNECTLDWLEEGLREPYYTKLYAQVAAEAVAISKNSDVQTYEGLFRSVHRALVNDLKGSGRRGVDVALNWWRDVDVVTVPFATCMATTARAFLSMQASSASAERLFSAAGYVEGGNRHNQSMAKMEMELVIRKWVLSELSVDGIEPGSLPSDAITPLANASQLFVNLVDRVAKSVVEAEPDGQHAVEE